MADKSVIVAGATGLVGSSLINILKDKASEGKLIILTRRDIPELRKYLSVKQHIINFDDTESYKDHVKADAVVCALGTTLKKAGSQENFRKVDYSYPLQIAEAASENKCEKYILVSAIGADPDSRVFYNRVKGELERDLVKYNFKSLHFLHPSLLLGERDEKRRGEELAQKILPLFSFFMPYKYRPIEADAVAQKIVRIISDDSAGVFKYEGRDFYDQAAKLPYN
jgi:uncharacterized protein YbjT (DUF2867 family)